MLTVEKLACLRGERLLFTNLSFQLETGGLIHLVGGNGVGKSSLLKLLAGFSQPLAGSINWKNKSIEEDVADYRQKVLFLPDHSPLKPSLNSQEHHQFWQALLAIEGASFEEVGLQEVSDLPCQMLSSGQRRRASLLLLDHQRELWLLDEPFVGLDQAGVTKLLEQIHAHRQRGGMVIVTSHIPMSFEKGVTLELTEFLPKDVANG